MEDEITVRTALVLAKLREHREAYVARVEDEQRKWYANVKKALRKAIRRANKEGKTFHTGNAIRNPQYPMLHTKRYDDAILKLEWEVESVVILSLAELKAYVNDDWSGFNAIGTTSITSGAITGAKISGGFPGGTFTVTNGTATLT